MNRLIIVVPAHNEESEIYDALRALTPPYQVDHNGAPIDPESYEIVVVDNGSDDRTAHEVARFCFEESKKPKIHLLNESEKSIVRARSLGFDFAVAQSPRPEIIVSTDADVRAHPMWICSIRDELSDPGIDVLSYGGGYPSSFWQSVPRLAKNYLRNVGTIYFDDQTTKWLRSESHMGPFTKQIHRDLGKPVTSGGYAIRTSAYLRSGGYRMEMLDGGEVYGESQRMVFRLQRQGATCLYVENAPYQDSPRRPLGEPNAFLSQRSYQPGRMTDIRGVRGRIAFQELDELGSTCDLLPVQRWVVDNFIFLPCVVQPSLIKNNPQYFAPIAQELTSQIENFWNQNPNPQGWRIYRLSSVLTDRFFSTIFEIALGWASGEAA